MPLFYADASALVKLVLAEPETGALRAYLAGADLVTSEIVLAEVPRAARRAAAHARGLPLGPLLEGVAQALDAVALLPLDGALLALAGALAEPDLRTLDAIHVAAACAVAPIDAFVSYDERQSAAARLAGLRTIAPGS